MLIITKEINSAQELEQAFAIRKQVFCVEQDVPEEIEMDEFDESAMHIIVNINDEPAGTARWRFTTKGAKLERFAVLREYRGIGVGEILVKHILNELSEHDYIYLNAQISVIKFYKKFGFVVVGNRFYEADIPHKKMLLKL